MITLFWGGWLRPFPSVHWLEIPMNYGVPVLLIAGSGVMCIPLARRLPYPPHRILLMLLAAILILLGLLFVVPAINSAIEAS